MYKFLQLEVSILLLLRQAKKSSKLSQTTILSQWKVEAKVKKASSRIFKKKKIYSLVISFTSGFLSSHSTKAECFSYKICTVFTCRQICAQYIAVVAVGHWLLPVHHHLQCGPSAASHSLPARLLVQLSTNLLVSGSQDWLVTAISCQQQKARYFIFSIMFCSWVIH